MRAGNAFAQIQALEEMWYSERMRSIRLRLAVALKGDTGPDVDILVGQVASFSEQLEFLYRRAVESIGTSGPNRLGLVGLGPRRLR